MADNMFKLESHPNWGAAIFVNNKDRYVHLICVRTIPLKLRKLFLLIKYNQVFIDKLSSVQQEF